MDLLITDLTEMSAGNYCVAGWCADEERMVRPLPDGSNWTQARLAASGVEPGATIRIRPVRRQHPGAYPHTTEDLIVEADSIALVSPPPANWFGWRAPRLVGEIQGAFLGHVEWNSEWQGVRQGAFVREGTRAPSLVGLVSTPASLEFIEDFEKLKVLLNDGDAVYKIAVVSRALKEAWRRRGLAAVNAAVPRSRRLHLRIGLARAFKDAKCYMMLNGVHA